MNALLLAGGAQAGKASTLQKRGQGDLTSQKVMTGALARGTFSANIEPQMYPVSKLHSCSMQLSFHTAFDGSWCMVLKGT